MLVPNRHSGYLAGIRLYPGGGKGGNSAPPPDPALIAAQIKSMGIQDSAIQEVLAMSKAMQPLQQEQIKFGLESGKTAFDQSQADRTYALERRGQLTGLQDTMLKDAKAFNEGDRANELSGKAQADVTSAFDNASAQQGRQMARMGINPSSGKSLAMNNETSIARAVAGAGAANRARTDARTEGYSLTDRASNSLSGYPAMGMQTTGSGAQFAANGVNIANAGLAGLNSGATSASQMAGSMGANATSMYGAQANYQANMQEEDQTGSILGGLGGLAMGAAKIAPMFMSDRRLKQDITLVGQDGNTGLNLYQFSYIDDLDQRRYIGVMSDEVRAVRPDAVTRFDDGFDRVDYSKLGIVMKEVV